MSTEKHLELAGSESDLKATRADVYAEVMVSRSNGSVIDAITEQYTTVIMDALDKLRLANAEPYLGLIDNQPHMWRI